MGSTTSVETQQESDSTEIVEPEQESGHTEIVEPQREWKLPPTEEYLLSLNEKDLCEYGFYLQKTTKSHIGAGCCCAIHPLFSPTAINCNAVYYSPLIIKLLTYGNHSIPEGTDPYEIMFNYLKNKEYYENIMDSFEKFIYTDKIFDDIFNYYMEHCGNVYSKYFTNDLFKTSIRCYLLESTSSNIFDNNFFSVINGICSFANEKSSK